MSWSYSRDADGPGGRAHILAKSRAEPLCQPSRSRGASGCHIFMAWLSGPISTGCSASRPCFTSRGGCSLRDAGTAPSGMEAEQGFPMLACSAQFRHFIFRGGWRGGDLVRFFFILEFSSLAQPGTLRLEEPPCSPQYGRTAPGGAQPPALPLLLSFIVVSFSAGRGPGHFSAGWEQI